MKVRRLSMEKFRCFHDGLAQRWMWMDGTRQVFRDRTHLHRHDTLSDQLPCADSAESYSEDPSRLGIADQFSQTIVAAHGGGST